MKVNPTDVAVSIYRIDGKTKALIQLELPEVCIARDSNGLIVDAVKVALQHAMRDAIYKWELDVQDSD